MKAPLALASALALTLMAIPAPAQQSGTPELGEVMVNTGRQNTRYAQQDRPVIGLRRQADAAVMTVSIISDTREEPTRRKEIYSVLEAMIERAPGAGIELVFGGGQRGPVTRANAKDLPHGWGGRVDTSRVDLMIKTPLTGSASAAQGKLQAFAQSIKGNGRATVTSGNSITLTIVNPDQYRDQIVSLVAQDAKHNAALFGPEFTFSLTGIDGQIAWSQVSSTEVFLYIPYRYSIVPK